MELKGFEQIFTDENLAESGIGNIGIYNEKDEPQPWMVDGTDTPPHTNFVVFMLFPPDSFLGITTTEPWDFTVDVFLYPDEHRIKATTIVTPTDYKYKDFEIEDKEVFDRVWNFMKGGVQIINDKWLKDIEEMEDMTKNKNEKSNGNTDGPNGCSQ